MLQASTSIPQPSVRGTSLAWLDDDVLTFTVLIALDNLILLNHAAGLTTADIDCALQHLLMPDALAGATADLVETDIALRFSCHVKTYPERHKRYLDLT